ncbi:MAG: hypothetical protein JNK48_02825 [Bryobacterales bacterium]|nr:hypothetical protein [Bryobacterales bacterium]
MRYLWTLVLIPLSLAGQRFYADDPLEFEPKPRNVPMAANRKLSDYYDLFSNQFGRPGERNSELGEPTRAKGVSTLGEPMQGAWWMKRHYYKRMSLEALQLGAGGRTPPSEGKWTIVSAKNEGVTPGFTVVDGAKRMFFVKFDPMSNPEMATAADAVTGRLFHAMGYHVPDNYIVYFSEERLEIGKDVKITGMLGKKRPMVWADVEEILRKVPKTADGKYRATASLALPGKPIGPPRYFGTRADDPNDVVPHEHRRDYRGLHVIDAWLDHDDSRAINNIDILVKEGGAQYIRHYQLDFGSTLGSATAKANSARSGTYFFSWKESAAQLFTLGLYVPYWAKADYPKFESIGKFEYKVFDPERWVPEYPNVAFLNRLPDDEFWAAKQVTAFTDEELKAIVAKGELSDAKAAEWLWRCLVERRNKIGRAYFTKVLPFDEFRVEGGELRWTDLPAKLGYWGETAVDVQWSSFDNGAGRKSPIAGQSGTKLPAMREGYWCATLTSRSKKTQTIDVYLRYSGGETAVVGIDRTW